LKPIYFCIPRWINQYDGYPVKLPVLFILISTWGLCFSHNNFQLKPERSVCAKRSWRIFNEYERPVETYRRTKSVFVFDKVVPKIKRMLHILRLQK